MDITSDIIRIHFTHERPKWLDYYNDKTKELYIFLEDNEYTKYVSCIQTTPHEVEELIKQRIEIMNHSGLHHINTDDVVMCYFMPYSSR